ncbi:hypothetical protein R6Q59_013202 [Mikania micrantha]
MNAMRIEAFLRVWVSLLLLTSACLIRFDTQTSLIFISYSRTATFKDLNALFVVVFIDIAAAGYNGISFKSGVFFVRKACVPDRHSQWRDTVAFVLLYQYRHS